MFLFETFQKSKSDTLIMNLLKLFLKMGFSTYPPSTKSSYFRAPPMMELLLLMFSDAPILGCEASPQTCQKILVQAELNWNVYFLSK